MITYHSVQFISDVIKSHKKESIPVEQKTRDLKTQLPILIKNQDNTWNTHIFSIRFVSNSTICKSVGNIPVYLLLGNEIREPHDNVYDLIQFVEAENFVPLITRF